jgi:hypothetical protein
MYLSMVVSHLLAWLAVGAGAIYAALVLTWYNTDGPNYRVGFDHREPVRSAKLLLVWLGVKILDVCLRSARALWEALLEASAEVGEWLMRRSPAVQATVRSRFLV